MNDAGCPDGPNARDHAFVQQPQQPDRERSTTISTPDNILTGRYFFGDSTQSFPARLDAGGQLPGFNTITPTRVQLVSISYVIRSGPNKVNEARYGWNRFAEGSFPQIRAFTLLDRTVAASSLADCSGPASHDSGLPMIWSR